MATHPEQDGDAPFAHAPLGASRPRAVREGRGPSGTAVPAASRRAPELDVARHLVLARAALPEDPRDARRPLPDVLDDDVDDGPATLDGARPSDRPAGGLADDRPRPFRTRPLVLPGEEPPAPAPVPAAAPAAPGPVADVRAALDELAHELDRARRVAARAEARLREGPGGIGPAGRPRASRAPSSASTSTSASAPAGHPLAIEMAVAGFSRGEVGVALAGQVGDPALVAQVLDEVYGPGSDAGTRITG